MSMSAIRRADRVLLDLSYERFKHDLRDHVLEIEGQAPHRVWYLRQNPGGWTGCVAVVETPERFFFHGDWDSANGMSVLGARALQIFFDDHPHDYVWGKYRLLGRKYKDQEDEWEHRLNAEALFKAARELFLELFDPVSEMKR